MKEDKVFLADVLEDNTVESALAAGASIFVCNEQANTVQIPSGVKVINAEVFRVEGTWKAYERNRNMIDKLSKRKKSLFTINGISVENALCKYLFWTNYKTGALQSALESIDTKYTTINSLSFFPGNKWKGILKYTISCLLSLKYALKRKRTPEQIISEAELGILVNDSFELKLYKGVIGKLKPDAFLLFHYGNIDFESMGFLHESTLKINLSEIDCGEIQPFVNLLSLNAEEISALNSISNHWQQMANELERYTYIRKTGIKKLLLNVAENLPARNLMPEIFGNHIKVFNTMNGIKSGEAHDADIYFDYWFVWDTAMQKLLMENCGISQDKLLVSGHLSQDQIAEFTFRNSIGIDTERIKNALVVSVFSVRGKRREKVDAFEVLYSYASEHPELLILVKPHPLENTRDYILPPPSCRNVIFIKEELKNSKEALYDQILISDLNLVFGSTVALECHWMGVPCISFEYRNKSFIYIAGQDDIQHIRSKEELLESIRSLKKRNSTKPILQSNVAEKIVSMVCTIN